jgi:hypothetical protein
MPIQSYFWRHWPLLTIALVIAAVAAAGFVVFPNHAAPDDHHGDRL